MAAYTTIDNPELYFQVKLYTGNGTAIGSGGQAITFDGEEDMQPDFVWIKERDDSTNHQAYDAVRGVTYRIYPDHPAAQDQQTEGVTAFGSDGFTVGNDGSTNGSSDTYVAWCWKAGTTFTNDASATSVGNTDSNGSASSTAGFSISKYEGAGSSLDIQVKHGLSVKPAVMFTKNIEEAGGNDWAVYHHKNTSAPETDYLKLSATTATTDNADIWNDTEPTSAVFTAGDHSGSNRSGDDFVSYHWNEVQGYSKFGYYTGNGQDTPNGVFVYLGFRPAMILVKATDDNSWVIANNKSPTDSNPVDNSLAANDSAAETTGNSDTTFDFLANGFRTNGNSGNNNSSGQGHVFMAFAEAPFVNSPFSTSISCVFYQKKCWTKA